MYSLIIINIMWISYMIDDRNKSKSTLQIILYVIIHSISNFGNVSFAKWTLFLPHINNN